VFRSIYYFLLAYIDGWPGTNIIHKRSCLEVLQCHTTLAYAHHHSFLFPYNLSKGHEDNELTIVIEILGAFGKMNFVSVNFRSRRQFTTRLIQPAPWSPRPWRGITVEECLYMAGTARGAVMLDSIVGS
jgi:hypothetical protein